MPHDIAQGMSVPFEDTFLIVGGNSIFAGTELDTIWQFDPSIQQYVKRSEKLSEGKYDSAAFMIPDDYIVCN